MFLSILYPDEASAAAPLTAEEPDYFPDLNLNQMVAKIVKGRERYHLEPYFYTALQDPSVILYRQNVLRDLENEAVLNAVFAFSGQIVEISDYLKAINKALLSADGDSKNHLTRGKHLNAVRRYIRSIEALPDALGGVSIGSEGLAAFVRYLNALRQSEAYRRMADWAERLCRNFDTVRYCMLIKEGTIRVRKYEGQAD
ncbi:MAG TPA: hypothetical protein PKE04_00815, partial [Clostridia bacterium]|nr:hypothetical protein [Clostridia bacterium]